MIDKFLDFLGTSIGKITAGALFAGMFAGKSFMKKWKAKTAAQKKIEAAEAEKQRILAEHTRNNDEQIEVQKIVCRISGFAEADRVGLFRYHNGDRTFNGECLRYVTCTAEDPAPGIASVINEYQKKFITPDIAYLLDKIDKEPTGCYVINVKDLVGTERILQDSYGLTKSYNFKMGKSVWEGVLSIVYMKDEYELDEEQIRKIQMCIKLINDLKNKL